MTDFLITKNADDFVGGAGEDRFILSGDSSKFATNDTLDGGAGVDILVFNSSAGLNPDQLAPLHSVEVLDLSGFASNTSVRLDGNVVAQAGGTIKFLYGSGTVLLDTADAIGAGRVVVGGTGQLQLRNLDQAVTIDDAFDGKVNGKDGSDTITGGAGDDVVHGQIGKDSLVGNGGNDALFGDTQDDILMGGAGNDTLDGGEDDDYIDGGADHDLIAGGVGFDTLFGGSGDDTVSGGADDNLISGDAGNDVITGGDGFDKILGGEGNDNLSGGAGNDDIHLGAGADTASGGAGYDTFVVEGGLSALITDFTPGNGLERIDLRAYGSVTSFADLHITDSDAGAVVAFAGTTLTLAGVKAAQLAGMDFVLTGQDPLDFHVAAGTDESVVETILQNAPAGSTVHLAAGEYHWDHQIRITRGDIALLGAGEGKTIIHSDIPATDAQSQIVFETLDGRKTIGTFAADAPVGSNQITLDDVGKIKVGTVIYIGQPNDAAYLEATGNKDLYFPEDSKISMVPYYLREQIAEVTAIDGNTLTLSKPVPYAFQSGKAFVAVQTMLDNIEIGGMTMQVDGPKADPYFFDNVDERWKGTSMISLDGVKYSNLHDLTILQSRDNPITINATFRLAMNNMTINGAHNKDRGDGYAIHIKESFEDSFTHLDVRYTRHGVLFSSFSAEHYNYLQFDFLNRDVNFHGSMDSGNVIRVDRDILDYDHLGDILKYQFDAVQGTTATDHQRPQTNIEDNDVRFKYLIAADHGDLVHADKGGAYISGWDGADTLYGDDGSDTLIAGRGDDVLVGGGSSDYFIRQFIENGADKIMDFDTRPVSKGGDQIVIQGYAFNKFSDLKITKSGADSLIDFGSFGSIRLVGVAPSELSSANFKFEKNGKAQTFEPDPKVTPSFILASDGADKIIIDKSFVSRHVPIWGGHSEDTVDLNGGFLKAETKDFGEFHSIERLDLASIKNITLKISSTSFLSQSSDKNLDLIIGDSKTAMSLDVGSPRFGSKLFIDGHRIVQLTSGRDQVVYSTDHVGTVIRGGEAKDTIYGGSKGDALSGGKGNDKLVGNGGNDTLDGGAGVDTLTGGKGSDKFVFDDGDLGKKTADADRITDFSQKAKDKIDLSQIDAVKGGGDSKFTWIGTDAFSGHAGELHVEKFSGYRMVSGDMNGDGHADFFLRVDGSMALRASDFIL